ncbi:MAG: hypothetical protein ACI906_000147 [Candidatus Latescibacterota bacterium]|jgi:hypothetical protein
MVKNILSAAMALALTTGAATAEIKLNDNFMVSGFLDMSAISDDGTKGMALDQAEIDFIFNYDNGLSLRADLQGSPNTTTSLEQAFMSYDMGDGLSLTMGKFLSVSGWEAAEPTGLYQYSTSATLVYGGYQHGAALSYSKEKFALFGSVVSSVWDGTDTSAEEVGFEAQLTLMPTEDVTAKAAFLYEDFGAFNTSLINVWASYGMGALLLAGEINLLSNWQADGNDGTGFLAMANYGISDKIGVTGRFSSLDTDAAETVSEFTISPSYMVNENWLIVTEAKFMSNGSDTSHFALESLLTF